MKKTLTTILITMMITLSMYSQSPWVALTSGTTQVLYSTSFANDTTGWVTGAAGTILKTANGTSFTAEMSGTTNDLMTSFAVDANTVFAAGNSSTIVKTTNGGASWSAVTSPVTADFRCVFFVSASIGFIGGGVSSTSAAIIKTTDGGATWSSLTTGTSNVIYSIYFTSAMIGYACDDHGVIINTTDGGTTWTSLTSGTTNWLQSLYFTSLTTGYAAGRNGTILKTTNAGVSWSALTTGSTDLLGSIRFLDANNGYASGGNIAGNTSTILKTHDAGATWTVESTSSTRQWSVSIPSFNAGYSCGLGGSIIKTTGIDAGINEMQNTSSFTIAPNPCTLYTTLNFSDEQRNATVNIIDALGRLVMTQKVTSKSVTLDMSGYSKGVYFVRIQDDKKNIINRKIVVQ